MKAWDILNSKFSILLLGFILTGVLGTYLTNKRQSEEWKKEKKFEIIKRKLDEGQSSLEKISDLINLRFYRLQNVYIYIVRGDLANAEKTMENYYKTVEEWNVKLIINQNKIRRLVNEEAADKFNNYETDDPKLKKAKSIHGMFYLAHQKVLDAYRYLKSSGSKLSYERKQEINTMLRDLDYESDNFIDEISDLFLERTIEFESLDE